MEGSFLRFYVHENQRHRHILLWDWLLGEANKMGIRGGSAFRAMAGFGRHHKLHEDHFFELQGTLPVEVGFVVTEDEAKLLFDLIEAEGLSLFYIKLPVEFGVTAGAPA